MVKLDPEHTVNEACQREEAVKIHAAVKADPSGGMSIDQVFADIKTVLKKVWSPV